MQEPTNRENSRAISPRDQQQLSPKDKTAAARIALDEQLGRQEPIRLVEVLLSSILPATMRSDCHKTKMECFYR